MITATGGGYDVLDRRYLCNKCNLNFSSSNAKLLARLPSCVQADIPFRCVGRMRIDKDILDLLCTARTLGVASNKLARHVHNIYIYICVCVYIYI